MAFLKRKRSESEFSSSSSSTLSSPLQLELSNHGVSIEPIPYGRTPSYLPSRTMKRFRNSRPSDQQVHRRFSAIVVLLERCAYSHLLRQNTLLASCTRLDNRDHQRFMTPALYPSPYHHRLPRPAIKGHCIPSGTFRHPYPETPHRPR